MHLDNYDELRKVDRRLADTLTGTPSAWTLAVRQTYEDLGLPRHPKKAVMQEVKAEVQGPWLDGEAGTAAPKGEKVAKYIRLACELLVRGRASQKELQIVGGGFVYIAMFRRPLLAGLNALWRRIIELDEGSHRRRGALGDAVELELVRFIALTPLAFMDFRTGISEEVTASDASTSGGGLCVSKELSPYGLAAAQAQCRGDILSQDDVEPILVVSLFDGVGALLVAVDALRGWKEDQHRFPPYQYKTVNCVTNGVQVRVPNVRERECILGFPLDYTAKCYPKSHQSSTAWQDCRLTLLGNTWSVPVVCYLLHSLFLTLGLNNPLTMSEIVSRLTPGEEDSEDSLPSLLLRPPLRRTTQQGGASTGLVRRLLGQVSVKGEDLLLTFQPVITGFEPRSRENCGVGEKLPGVAMDRCCRAHQCVGTTSSEDRIVMENPGAQGAANTFLASR